MSKGNLALLFAAVNTHAIHTGRNKHFLWLNGRRPGVNHAPADFTWFVQSLKKKKECHILVFYFSRVSCLPVLVLYMASFKYPGMKIFLLRATFSSVAEYRLFFLPFSHLSMKTYLMTRYLSKNKSPSGRSSLPLATSIQL